MPCKAEGLVLTVDPNLIHKVDTNNAENLFSMWTVFSRCADSVEQGRRLENLSWRLWNRETFCCETSKAESSPMSIARHSPLSKITDMPPLSASLESSNSEDAIEDLVDEAEPHLHIRPHVVRQDSCSSNRSRGREPHITSDRLEQMVVHIVNGKENKLAPLPQHVQASIPTPKVVVDSPPPRPASPLQRQPSSASDSQNTASDVMPQSQSTSSPVSETVGTPAKTTVRGFFPASLPVRSAPQPTEPKVSQPEVIPAPDAQPPAKHVQQKGKKAGFFIGTDSDSSPQSMENDYDMPAPKTSAPAPRGSSSDGQSPSLKSALARPHLGAQKKTASFANIVATHRASQQAISDQSDDYDESAIDDDDSDSEWEDSIEESGKSSLDDQVTFKRVPSKSNLTSQRSLISLMFAGQDQRTKALSSHASQSTPAIPQRSRTMQNMSTMANSPNDSDEGLQMKKGMRPPQLKPINEIPRSTAQPITAHAQPIRHQAALSPRTTRRNMLATELTESLRRQLLWERQQKTSTANAVLKRRHTSHDVANLKQYPEKVHMNKAADEPSTSWNQYFNRDTQGGYHAQGW
ncbi:uncharacterized protein B0I36DRAFT_375562 [Microdochium trichocladiopsis]|uniref:Nitrogen regulatory protein areA GATA-like domain-containing protein n=1 Tax=Microdochium trichocladiopsis TaxID=1682393 RepID=A0A9P8Y2X5_9PEZI|nr:uncharacterized protein B0I36DRAFT_375562 [Microdochium trichocladiopsis]KAH7027918.1 hypothetical protein B0I36DRAFT_375562 [Microdochium trichocladiopsis]